MDTDLIIVVGIVCIVLAVPSLLSSWVDGSPPRAGAILVLIGGVLIVVALTQHGRGYSFGEMPGVFKRVISRFTN